MQKEISVLGISYGRNLFDANNVERKRLALCAQQVAEYHTIVFSLRSHNLSPVVVGNFYLYPTQSRNRLFMLFDAWRIGKKLLKEHPKKQWVLTAQDPFEAGVLCCLLARCFRVPCNVQEHGDFYSTPHWKKDTFLNRFRFILGKYILRRADSVRVVSKRISNTIIKLGVEAKKVLLLPVRSDAITPAIEKQVPRTDQPVSDRPLVVLGMGRLVTQKNFPLLIDAFATLNTQVPNTTLQIVGSGPEEERLKQKVAQMNLTDKVAFIPWTDEPLRLIAQADIFALSSDWEGWARVLVEAMAVGTPIVTTDVGCANEVIIDNEHGLVVPVRDTDAFAEALLTLASDMQLRERFSTNAIADYKNVHSHSLDEYAIKWAQVLADTIVLKKSS